MWESPTTGVFYKPEAWTMDDRSSPHLEDLPQSPQQMKSYFWGSSHSVYFKVAMWQMCPQLKFTSSRWRWFVFQHRPSFTRLTSSLPGQHSPQHFVLWMCPPVSGIEMLESSGVDSKDIFLLLFLSFPRLTCFSFIWTRVTLGQCHLTWTILSPWLRPLCFNEFIDKKEPYLFLAKMTI